MDDKSRDETWERLKELEQRSLLPEKKRTFETGAMRDTDEGKLDFEGFLSPLVLQRYAEYMHRNRKMADGTLRSSDNWQKGIPIDQYMKSLWRHFMATWRKHRTKFSVTKSERLDDLCGVLFNAMGYMHELLKEDEQ